MQSVQPAEKWIVGGSVYELVSFLEAMRAIDRVNGLRVSEIAYPHMSYGKKRSVTALDRNTPFRPNHQRTPSTAVVPPKPTQPSRQRSFVRFLKSATGRRSFEGRHGAHHQFGEVAIYLLVVRNLGGRARKATGFSIDMAVEGGRKIIT